MTARFIAVVAASFAAYAVMVLSSLNLRSAEDGEQRSRRDWLAPASALRPVAGSSQPNPAAGTHALARRLGGVAASQASAASAGTADERPGTLRSASATPAEAVRKVAVGARRDL